MYWSCRLPVSPAPQNQEGHVAEVSTFSCDICGKLKRDVNKWFRAHTQTDYFQIEKWESKQPLIEDELPILHLCGMECATKAMAKAMEGE
jgi:hypothetical protein